MSLGNAELIAMIDSAALLKLFQTAQLRRPAEEYGHDSRHEIRQLFYSFIEDLTHLRAEIRVDDLGLPDDRFNDRHVDEIVGT